MKKEMRKREEEEIREVKVKRERLQKKKKENEGKIRRNVITFCQRKKEEKLYFS